MQTYKNIEFIFILIIFTNDSVASVNILNFNSISTDYLAKRIQIRRLVKRSKSSWKLKIIVVLIVGHVAFLISWILNVNDGEQMQLEINETIIDQSAAK